MRKKDGLFRVVFTSPAHSFETLAWTGSEAEANEVCVRVRDYMREGHIGGKVFVNRAEGGAILQPSDNVKVAIESLEWVLENTEVA